MDTRRITVEYLVEEWSRQWIIEPLPEGTMDGELVDCGEWESIEQWMEGVLPGTYIVDFGETGKITVITGKDPQ